MSRSPFAAGGPLPQRRRSQSPAGRLTTYQKRFATGIVVLALAACQAAPQKPAEGPAEQPLTQAPALPQGARYLVNPQASEVRVLVYRGGPLARLGHNHVMVAPLQGEIRAGDTSAASGFRVELTVDALQVDPPEPRAEEGEAFATDVSDQARQGTRDNMLGERLLDASRYPRIVIESVALSGPRWNPDVQANVTLHGTTVAVQFAAAVVEHGDTLTVIATLPLELSKFGIEPFSALGGGLQVLDRIGLRVRLVAQRTH